MFVRASAKANNVDRTTLSRYTKDAKDEEGTEFLVIYGLIN